MSGIAGLRGTGDWGTDERPKNFRQGILRFNPNGTSPIFALTAKAKKRTVDDPEFAWWAEGNSLIRLQVNGALGAADTLVTVDSPDPSSSALGINYGTATHLKPGDILLVEPATDNATFDHELIEVDSVLSDTQFNVKRAAGGTSAAAIANDVWLTVIGSSYAEGTSAPRATSRNPVKFSNYTQIFKDSYEITGTADETMTRTGNTWSEDKKRKAFKHSQDIEAAILFGRAAETVGDNGKPKRYMGGLRSFIPSANVTVFGAAVTAASFTTAVAPIFDFNTGAGDSRMMFCGATAALELGKIFNAVTQVRLNSAEYVKVYGVDFQKFILPMGTLLLKIHPLMSRHGLYKSSAFVVDFDALSYVAMKNRDTKSHDDVQNADEDVRRGYFQTECSVEVDYGGLTMAYLGKISST